MSITDHIPGDIKRVSRSIGYALWLDNDERWIGLRSVMQARLDERQRAVLAYLALTSLDCHNALHVAEGALKQGAGQPQVPLISHLDEAAFWADHADPQELEAYCLASFKHMNPERQAAFLEYVNGRAAA